MNFRDWDIVLSVCHMPLNVISCHLVIFPDSVTVWWDQGYFGITPCIPRSLCCHHHNSEVTIFAHLENKVASEGNWPPPQLSRCFKEAKGYAKHGSSQLPIATLQTLALLLLSDSRRFVTR